VKLKHKLFSGYLTIVGLALFLCLLSLNGYRIVHTHFMTTTQGILPGQQAMMNAKQAALAMVVESRDYLRTGDEIHVQFARESINDLRETLRTHLEHETHAGEAEKGVAEEMERRALRLIDLCNDLIEAYQRGASEETLSDGREEIRLGKDELFEILDKHLAVHEQELLDAQDAIYRTITNGFWTFLETSVLILALGLAIVLYMAKSILAPIHELERGAGVIGGGDLDYRLDIQTGDEIERLAAAFNGMADQLANMVDTLEQRVAERTRDLRVSEEWFRDIAESSADWIWEMDATGRYTYCSEGVVDVLGYTPEELLGQTPFELMPPAEAARVGEIFAEIAANKQPIVDLENRNLTKDGREVILLTSGVPILDSEGNLLGYRGVDKDITARKQAEAERERLLAAERAQRLLAETLREVTLALTAQTSRKDVLDEILRQAQRIVPHSTANIALLEDDALHIVHWQGYEASPWKDWASDLVQPLADWSLDAEVIRSRKPLVIPDTRQEPRWVVLDETAWIRSYLSVPICLRDRVLGLLRLDGDTPGQFSAEDAQRLQPLASAAAIAIENARLVENLEAEVAARTAEICAEQEKNEAILRSVGHSIVMTDLDNRIQYVNETFTTLTGYTAQDAIGQHLKFLFGEPMAEQKRQALRLTLAQGQVWQGETSRRRKNGRTYDAALTIAPLRDAEGRIVGYVSSHHDITRIKDLERARSRFVTNVSHQLRTPVATLKTFIYLLRKGTHPEKADRYLQMMEEEIAQLTHLIQDILEMATLDSGRAVVAWEPVSLPIVIGDIVTRFHDQAEASDLMLVTTPIPPDLPVIKGDHAQLFQALKEVVENAIIFTPAGGQVMVDVETVEDEGWSWVTITVRDTGPGISPAEQERIFDRFFRGSLAESGHVPGTGLGLSITQEIVRAHGGRVTVESELGRGSTFTLWLRSAPR